MPCTKPAYGFEPSLSVPMNECNVLTVPLNVILNTVPRLLLPPA